jgi:hypothetical protein
MSDHFMPPRMAVMKGWKTTCVGEGAGKLGCSYTAGGSVEWSSHSGELPDSS